MTLTRYFQIPWGQHSPENYSITHAQKVLDEDHYGLKDVKDRILEFLAVGKLRGTVEGKIICLVGPPGVGKTLSAEATSEHLRRPLYIVGSGDLGTTAHELDNALEEAFELPLVAPLRMLDEVTEEEIDELDRQFPSPPPLKR